MDAYGIEAQRKSIYDDLDALNDFGIEILNNMDDKIVKKGNMDKEKIEQAVRLFLEGIGEDVNREGLVDTPKRISNMEENAASVEETTAVTTEINEGLRKMTENANIQAERSDEIRTRPEQLKISALTSQTRRRISSGRF